MLRLEARLTTVRTLAFSPDNRYLLAVGVKSGLGGLLTFSRFALYDLADPRATPTLRIDYRHDPIAGYFLPDGRALGVDDRGSWVTAWVNETETTRGRPAAITGKFEPAAVSPNGRRLALIGRQSFRCELLTPDATAPSFWEVQTAFQDYKPTCAAFAPDSQWVAVCEAGPELVGFAFPGVGRVFDTNSGNAIGSLDLRRHAPVLRLVWSPDGRFLVTVEQSSFHAWTGDTLSFTAVRVQHDMRIVAAAFHPAGELFVTAEDTGRLMCWDVAEWQRPPEHSYPYRDADRPPARTLDWSVGSIQALAFSPDGTLGAVAGKQGEVVVWDADE